MPPPQVVRNLHVAGQLLGFSLKDNALHYMPMEWQPAQFSQTIIQSFDHPPVSYDAADRHGRIRRALAVPRA